jgi:hypothetical protein
MGSWGGREADREETGSSQRGRSRQTGNRMFKRERRRQTGNRMLERERGRQTGNKKFERERGRQRGLESKKRIEADIHEIGS